MKKWKTKSSEIVFNTKWVKVQKDTIELPSGKTIDDFYMWRERDVSQIVAVTHKNKIVFVKQYKHAAGEFTIELPAGYVEVNEDFERTASRELLEETGYSGEKFEYLGKLIHSTNKSPSIVKVFLVKDAKRVTKQKIVDYEEPEVLEISINEVIKMISDGNIYGSGTIASIFLALNKLKYKI